MRYLLQILILGGMISCGDLNNTSETPDESKHDSHQDEQLKDLKDRMQQDKQESDLGFTEERSVSDEQNLRISALEESDEEQAAAIQTIEESLARETEARLASDVQHTQGIEENKAAIIDLATQYEKLREKHKQDVESITADLEQRFGQVESSLSQMESGFNDRLVEREKKVAALKASLETMFADQYKTFTKRLFAMTADVHQANIEQDAQFQAALEELREELTGKILDQEVMFADMMIAQGDALFEASVALNQRLRHEMLERTRVLAAEVVDRTTALQAALRLQSFAFQRALVWQTDYLLEVNHQVEMRLFDEIQFATSMVAEFVAAETSWLVVEVAVLKETHKEDFQSLKSSLVTLNNTLLDHSAKLQKVLGSIAALESQSQSYQQQLQQIAQDDGQAESQIADIKALVEGEIAKIEGMVESVLALLAEIHVIGSEDNIAAKLDALRVQIEGLKDQV